MATSYTEGKHAGEFLVSEANGTRSRSTITVASGQTLVAGAVLGKVTATGEYKAYDNATNTGIETAVAVLWDAVDASAASTVGVAIVRQAEVNQSELTFATTQTAADKTAAYTDLASAGIIVR